MKHQIEAQQKQVQSLAEDLGKLKKALQTKALRDALFGIVKIAMVFIGGWYSGLGVIIFRYV